MFVQIPPPENRGPFQYKDAVLAVLLRKQMVVRWSCLHNGISTLKRWHLRNTPRLALDNVFIQYDGVVVLYLNVDDSALIENNDLLPNR